VTTTTLPPEASSPPTSERTWPWEIPGARRAEHLESLRARIESGEYEVPAAAVADAVLEAAAHARRAAPEPGAAHRVRPRTRVERLVREHLELVHDVVNRVAAGFPSHVERDDLLDAGRLGLVEAARRYDPTTGVPFARYAAIRIRGAVLDSTRTRDWVSRSVRRRARELNEAEQHLTAANGRSPRTPELASALGVSVDKVDRLRADAAASMLLSLDFESEGSDAARDRIADAAAPGPEASLEQVELLGTLREAVSELPGVHGMAVRRYYFGGELLQSIAADLGVTEARVSQIIAEAVSALRRYFCSLYEGVPDVDERAPGQRTRAEFLARLTERSTWRSRLAAGEAGLVIDLRDPDNVTVSSSRP